MADQAVGTPQAPQSIGRHVLKFSCSEVEEEQENVLDRNSLLWAALSQVLIVAILGELAKPTKSIYLTLTLLSLSNWH